MSHASRRRARRLLPLFAIPFILLTASVVLAQNEALGGKLRTGETITIAADETVEGDLYAAAGTVVVQGTVAGDLVVGSGDVQIAGTVEGDLIAAAGSVSVAGTVRGDARVAGGTTVVTGAIGEDLLLLAGTATIADGATVGEDLIASAGTLTLHGDVAGNVQGAAGSYERTGTVGGSENVAVGDGDTPAPAAPRNPVLNAIRHFVAVLLIGALALWLMPATTTAAAALIRSRPLASIGIGLLAFVGFLVGWIAIVILMIVLALLLGLLGFGELLALVFFAAIVAILASVVIFWLIVAYLADAIVGLGVAGLVRGVPAGRWTQLGLLAAGAALVVVLISLPIVGGVVKLVVAIIGMGALTLAAWTAWRARAAVPISPPASVPPPAAQEPPSTWGA